MTLIEVMVSLSIFALVVGGALALFASASTTQTTTQMKSDLAALRSATKNLFMGQGTYGTAVLTETLIIAKQVPSTLAVSGAVGSRVITTSQTGTVVITGATSLFTITVTNVSTDVCTGLTAGTSGWSAVRIGATTYSNFPLSPVTSATACAVTNPITLVFTST
jgi:prepilin-type N-terminal cleavage/methylation domain-containing protein